MDSLRSPTPAAQGRIFVVLPVFKAEPAYLREQIASLSAQTAPGVFVVCVNADTASRDLIDTCLAISDLPYHIADPEGPLDSYRAFEFGLTAAMEMSQDGDVFALCDQDDYWRDDKLDRCIACMKESRVDLVHSDARIVGPDGRPRHPSLHRQEHRVRAPGLRQLLLRNTVTGMTCVLSRRLLKAALPFPSQAALFFHHDLWLALVAGAMRGIAFVDEPLVDYRQHAANVVGALDGRTRSPRFGTAPWRRQRAGDYFVAAYLAKSLYLRMVEVSEVDRASVNQRALSTLAPYLACSGPGMGLLGDALLLAAKGRFSLALRSFVYSGVRMARIGWAVRRIVPKDLVPALAEFDRKGFALAPGMQPGPLTRDPQSQSARHIRDVASFADRRMAPRFDVTLDAERRPGVVILMPTLNPTEIFAGIATAIDFGVGLAAKGHNVVFVACDLPISSRSASRNFVLGRAAAFQGPMRMSERIQLRCGVTDGCIRLHRDDRFLATAWWSAHVARHLIDRYGLAEKRFFYLIQDFEPNFYPWSDESAAALASYDFNHVPIFNTSLLRDYFVEHGIGAATGRDIAFHPSIDIARFAALPRRARRRRRLVLYGRPEVPRNLFSTMMLAVDGFVSRAGLSEEDIEILSVGLSHDTIRLSSGATIYSAGKIPWDDYPAFLAKADLGCALMLSPHPSHLPIEMAAAGARVVTNSFGGKDLSRVSPAILSPPPAITALSDALTRSWNAPAVCADERKIDLTRLGMPLREAVSAIDSDLRGVPHGVLLKASA